MATLMAVARHLRSAVSSTHGSCMLTGSLRPSLSCTTTVVCRRLFRSCSWSGTCSWQQWWSGWVRERARLMNMRPLLCAATVFFWDRERITNQEVMSCLERFKNSQLWRTDSDSSSNDSHTSEQTRTASQCSTPCEGDSCEKDECMSTCQVEGGVAGKDMSREKTTEGLADGGCEGDSESGDGDSESDDGDSNVSVTDKLKSLTASSNTSHVEHGMQATVGDNEGNTTQASSSSSSDISQSPSDTRVVHVEVSDDVGCNVTSDRDEHSVSGTLPASGDSQSQSKGETHNTEVTERMVEAEQEKGHENGNQELVGVVVEQSSNIGHADDGDKRANNLSGDDDMENRNQSVLVVSGSEKENSETKEEEEDPLADWDFLLKEQSCTIYRKQYENTGLYQFKVLGRYTDITAKDYLDVQVDNEAQKVWDTYVVKLDTVDRDPNTGSEIVHWILNFQWLIESTCLHVVPGSTIIMTL